MTRALARLGVLLAGALALACSKPEPVPHYRTRGLVRGVSGQGLDTRAEIHHERIEAFRDRDGKPSPMDSMRMNFAFAPGVSSELAAGDKVAFEFDVHWSSGSPLIITRLERLPAATELSLHE
jgi:hypothetical protein